MAKKQTRRTRAKKQVKARSSKEHEYVDAKKSFTLHVTWEDINSAVPGDSRNCVLSRAGRREHNCFDIVVWRYVAYVRKNEGSIPVRYQITQAAHDLLVSFDASGRSRPITVTFVPPRRALSRIYLQSAQRKKAMRASKERCKKRREAHRQAVEQGHGRRKTYTKPDPLTLFGVRNGGTGRPFAKLRT